MLESLKDELFPDSSLQATPPSPITNPDHPLHRVNLQHFLTQTRYVTSRAMGQNYNNKTYRKWNDPNNPEHPPAILIHQIPPLHQVGFQLN